MVRKPSVRIFIIVYGGLAVLSAYLIGSNYVRQLDQAEKSTLSKLYGIASTLSQQVSRDALSELYTQFPLNGDTSGISQSPVWKMYCDLFKDAVEINQLKTPIYTLSYDSVSDAFLGGVASNGSATYGWEYKSPPNELRKVYNTGGTIPPFSDDHGTWLSAVYPLKDKNGKVFAVVEADYPFDSFIEEARSEAMRDLMVSVLVMLIIGAITYPVLGQVLNSEERSKLALAEAKDRLQEKNDEVMSSLEYARTIQETMLPTSSEMGQFFGHSFVLNRPRDIVSGDFYWFHQLDEKRALIAVADCTGHGVPGALMSIMGHGYLNEVVIEQKVDSPAEILERLDQKIHETFTDQGSDPSKGTDGMDLGICLVDRGLNTITFAGARRPLTITCVEQNVHVSGAKRGIGEHFLADQVRFENTVLELRNDCMYYLYTDGMQDQFGGENSKKLLRKRLTDWLSELKDLPDDLHLETLQTRFSEWKGENPQIDDVCLAGFRV